MSALTLFEILKFNEPIRSSTTGDFVLLLLPFLLLSLFLCAKRSARERERERDVRGGRENEKRDTAKDVLFVIQLTEPFDPRIFGRSKATLSPPSPSYSYNQR